MTMRFPWSPRSLRMRLALWYLLVLGATLALFSSVVFLSVRQSLFDGLDAALATRAETVAGQVSVGPSGAARYQGNDAPTAEGETAVYLFDAQGHLSETIAGAKELPPQQKLLGAAPSGRSYATVGEIRYYTAGLPDDSGQVIGAVQVVQSLDAANSQRDHLLAVLLVATPLLLAVATAGGVFLAGRALAPIDSITRTAREIGAGNLTGRLDLVPRDDEVGRLATTFNSMLGRLERSFAQQRQFAADASHELRTPLAIITGDLDVLLMKERTPADYKMTMHAVADEVAHLGRLVEDLLTLARADSGQTELAREFVYLDALVADTVGGLRRLAEAKGVALHTRLEPDVAIVGDTARLRQLVLNLLGNAVKYTPAGRRVEITLASNAGWARLEVADTGIGIASADLPHVFDRFFRTDEARGREEGGAGLGLSIARWCVEAHGGRIEVRSRQGEGSVFTALLPLAPTEDGDEA